MKPPSHALSVLTFAVFTTTASFALARSDPAAPSSFVAQPKSEDEIRSNAIGSQRDHALLGELQQEKISRGMMLADAACSTNCRFYGGQY
jgi:hypothetical protein